MLCCARWAHAGRALSGHAAHAPSPPPPRDRPSSAQGEGEGGGDDDDDDLEDELFERELENMAKYGSEDEEPRSFAALHKRLSAQRRAEAAEAAAAGERRAHASARWGPLCALLPAAACCCSRAQPALQHQRQPSRHHA